MDGPTTLLRPGPGDGGPSPGRVVGTAGVLLGQVGAEVPALVSAEARMDVATASLRPGVYAFPPAGRLARCPGRLIDRAVVLGPTDDEPSEDVPSPDPEDDR